MDSFRFEQPVKMKAKLYSEIMNKKMGEENSSGQARKFIKLIVVSVLGIACLLTKYTLLLGVVVLGFVCLALFLPKKLPQGIRNHYHGQRYLHDELTYSIDNSRLYVKGQRFEGNCEWSLLETWCIRGDWLLLSPSGIPTLFFSRSKLKDSGIYKLVMEMATEHGKEFK